MGTSDILWGKTIFACIPQCPTGIGFSKLQSHSQEMQLAQLAILSHYVSSADLSTPVGAAELGDARPIVLASPIHTALLISHPCPIMAQALC